MAIEIIPAIMPDSYTDLTAKFDRVAGLVPLVQIDVMDGIFVPSVSWPYQSGGVEDVDFLRLARHEAGMPHWETMDVEIDLMIADPLLHIDDWLTLGASRVIFHIEAISDLGAFFAHPVFQSTKEERGVELGLALNSDTEVEILLPYINQLDVVQCMGIAKIGYQGQPFDERVLAQINRLRVAYPNLPISVDGGVNQDTAALLKSAGATRLVAGSAIFAAEDAGQAIAALQMACR